MKFLISVELASKIDIEFLNQDLIFYLFDRVGLLDKSLALFSNSFFYPEKVHLKNRVRNSSSGFRAVSGVGSESFLFSFFFFSYYDQLQTVVWSSTGEKCNSHREIGR